MYTYIYIYIYIYVYIHIYMYLVKTSSICVKARIEFVDTGICDSQMLAKKLPIIRTATCSFPYINAYTDTDTDTDIDRDTDTETFPNVETYIDTDTDYLGRRC